MAQSRTRFMGMDVSKDAIAVAYVAQDHDAEPCAAFSSLSRSPSWPSWGT
jgi:hypothetical protein